MNFEKLNRMHTDIVLRLKKDTPFITGLRSRIMRSLVFGRGKRYEDQQGVGSIFQSDRKCKRSDKPDRKKIVRGTVSAARAVGFTLPDNRKSAKAFEKEDLVVFGTPVYAGRVPNKILPWGSRDLQEIIHLWYRWLF